MYQAPHDARDNEKLQNMIDFLNDGGDLPAIIVCGERAFTGSHRIAAWEEAGLDAFVIEIDDNEVAVAMIKAGLDPEYDEIDDYNEFCEALYETIDFDDVREAIADQF